MSERGDRFVGYACPRRNSPATAGVRGLGRLLPGRWLFSGCTLAPPGERVGHGHQRGEGREQQHGWSVGQPLNRSQERFVEGRIKAAATPVVPRPSNKRPVMRRFGPPAMSFVGEKDAQTIEPRRQKRPGPDGASARESGAGGEIPLKKASSVHASLGGKHRQAGDDGEVPGDHAGKGQIGQA